MYNGDQDKCGVLEWTATSIKERMSCLSNYAFNSVKITTLYCFQCCTTSMTAQNPPHTRLTELLLPFAMDLAPWRDS